MVDEYQDTNHVQFQFIMKLAGSNGNLCVVGDDGKGEGWPRCEDQMVI